MEAILLVTPEQLQATAQCFLNNAICIEKLVNHMLDMMAYINNIEKIDDKPFTWHDTGSKDYEVQFSEWKEQLNCSFARISEHVSDLEQLSACYIETTGWPPPWYIPEPLPDTTDWF